MIQKYPKGKTTTICWCLFWALTATQLEGLAPHSQNNHSPAAQPVFHNHPDAIAAACCVTDSSNLVRPVATRSMKFLHFSAAGSNGKVSIGWKVINEKGEFEYIIERSGNAVDFMPVGTLVSRPAFSSTNNYCFTDLAPVVNHTNYYRIRSIDVSGNSAFSSVVKVKLSTPVGSLFILPNPADASASLSMMSKTNGTVGIRLVNTSGHLCWHLHFSVRPGTNVLLLDGLEKLPNGMYTVQCNDGRKKIKQLQLLVKH